MDTTVTEQRRPQSLLGTAASHATELPLVTLVISACTLLLACSPEMSQQLQFNREAVAPGQLWQIFTGHLTHWGWNHLVWDLAVFAVLGALCESLHRVRYLICLAVSAILIPLGICLFSPELNTYRGLSGIDTGLFAMLSGYLLFEKWSAREWAWVAILAISQLGLGLKFAFEIASKQTLFVDCVAANFQPVPLAHAIGACVGISVAVWSVLAGGGPVCLRQDSARFHTNEQREL